MFANLYIYSKKYITTWGRLITESPYNMHKITLHAIELEVDESITENPCNMLRNYYILDKSNTENPTNMHKIT